MLGIFLGSVGAHDFYLGETHTKKEIIHVCLFGSGLVVEILASAILPSALSFSARRSVKKAETVTFPLTETTAAMIGLIIDLFFI